MKRTPKTLVAAALLVLAIVALLAPSGAATAPASSALTTKAIFFASDGMRPDLMDKYRAAGKMPTYADLVAKGVKGDNGLTQGFPPNTGVGWYTLEIGRAHV